MSQVQMWQLGLTLAMGWRDHLAGGNSCPTSMADFGAWSNISPAQDLAEDTAAGDLVPRA
jgi:hypothetical protein